VGLASHMGELTIKSLTSLFDYAGQRALWCTCLGLLFTCVLSLRYETQRGTLNPLERNHRGFKVYLIG
jgi:hypothetical protein